MSLLITILSFLLAIGILVTIHEFGHYWVAKRCGIQVLTFSIGFGRPLLTWQRGETQWQIAAIPFGGFVKMLDEREDAVDPVDQPRAFNRQSPYKRIAVVAAGPLANFALAIVLYWLIFMGGVEALAPRVGTVVPGSLAAQAGLQVGDTIAQMDGETIGSWADAQLKLVDAASSRALLPIHVQRSSGELASLRLDLSSLQSEQVDIHLTAILGLSPVAYVVQEIKPGSAAERGGLQVGDQPLRVGEHMTPDWGAFASAISLYPGKPVQVQVLRRGQMHNLTVLPQAHQQGDKFIGRIGAGGSVAAASLQGLRQKQQFGPLPALGKALSKVWETSALSLKMLGRMLTGLISYKQLSGPVAIADYAGQSARSGLVSYLEYLCLISISLGVLNLLPIPVLDGGHLLYYSAEIVRGKPVSDRVMELAGRFGVGVLAALMLVAMFNDITRLFAS